MGVDYTDIIDKLRYLSQQNTELKAEIESLRKEFQYLKDSFILHSRGMNEVDLMEWAVGEDEI